MPMIYDPTGEPIEIAEGRGDLRFSSVPFDAWGMGGQLPLIGDKVVSYASLFASQTWVAAAVMRMLTWSVRVPLKCYRRTGDDSRERVLDHPVARAISDPWERGSQADLVMSLLGPLLIHGNGLERILNGARDEVRFDPILWGKAKPIQPFEKWVSGWDVTEDRQTTTVAADEMVHLRWWSPLGPMGISPLQQLGVTIRIEEAAQRFQQGYLQRGARPGSAIQAPPGVALDKETRAEIRESIDRLYAGPDNAGRPPLLPAGLEWKEISHNAHDAELIQQRKLTREEVAAVYQIPPPMIGILDQATYSNIETQREMSYTDALGPPLVLIEQALNAQLIRGLLREDDLYVEFDFGHVLRGDRLKEMQALRLAISSALMTPNEGRGALNLPDSSEDGADDLYLPANNLRPLGSTEEIPTP